MNISQKRKNYGFLIALGFVVLLSACSGGGSGGSTSGTGSSTVQGNVVSLGVAMFEPAQSSDSFFADLFTSLLGVSVAHADSGVEGISVTIGQMGTTTDAGGYFMLSGVPPGTHQVMFSKNGIVSSMSVNVGENDQVTMENISIHGSQARAQSISHMSTGATGTPGNPGMS